MTFDALIIGAGISGLVAARLLSREGLRVALLEQHQALGGYLQRFSIRATPFDAGVHYVGALGEGQILHRYLRHLGVTLRARPMRPDGFEALYLPSGRLDLPWGHQAYARAWIARFPHEAEGLRRYVEAIEAEVARFPMYSLEGSLSERGQPSTTRTLASVLDGLISDPALKEALAYPALLYFVHPRQAPFTLHAFVLDSYLRGAYTLDGGGVTLVEALAGQIRAAGGRVEVGAEVVSLEVDAARRVEGLRLADGRRLRAPLIIAALDPKRVVRMLPPGAARPAYTRRVLGLTEGLSALSGYLRVEADLGDALGRNHHVLPRGWLDALFGGGWLDDPRATFPVTALLPGYAEGLIQPVHLFTGISAAPFAAFEGTRTGRRGEGYRRLKHKLLQRQLDAARAAGLPVDPLRSSHGATPLTYRDYSGNSGGAVYGLRHGVDQIGGRGASARTPVGGLRLTGHSTLFPGLLGAIISAYYTCAEVLGLERLYGELRRA